MTDLVARGDFDVKMNPEPPFDVVDGIALARATFDKTFRGDLAATSVVTFMSCLNADRSAGSYVAFERVHGTLGGKTGTFVFQHSGTSTATGQRLDLNVVAGSGTGGLKGLEGEAEIIIDAAGHHYVFTYRFAG